MLSVAPRSLERVRRLAELPLEHSGARGRGLAVGRRARVTWYYAMFKPIKWPPALPGNLVPVGILVHGLSFAHSRSTTGTHAKRAAFAAARGIPAGPKFQLQRNPLPRSCGLVRIS